MTTRLDLLYESFQVLSSGLLPPPESLVLACSPRRSVEMDQGIFTVEYVFLVILDNAQPSAPAAIQSSILEVSRG